MMCFKILTTANKINSNDVSLFLKSGAALDLKAEKAKPSLSFISDKMWLNVMALSRHVFASEPIAFFRELPELVQKNDQAWKGWIDKPDPENFPIPDFSERLL
jgi:dynein heavy chain